MYTGIFFQNPYKWKKYGSSSLEIVWKYNFSTHCKFTDAIANSMSMDVSLFFPVYRFTLRGIIYIKIL